MTSAAPASDRGGFAALDPCVHCGFCLSACPTYLATGDESDSPRGRILLMRALERGELAATDPGLVEHIDACLGCRGCEPVCPSGVGYGRGLEITRARLAAANGLPPLARLILGAFARPAVTTLGTAAARVLRGTGFARRWAGSGRLGFLFGMIAGSQSEPSQPTTRDRQPSGAPDRGTVALFRGCVMDGLFDHVHQATRRTLEVNGYRVVEVSGQTCCGALHDHAGDQAGARKLAARNVEAFGTEADYVVVNSAGCGALLKDYGHLLGTEASGRFAERVRDVTELLAAAGPTVGAPLPMTVAYDAPCHLQHAQGVHRDPLQVLRSIPDLDLQLLPGSDRCCGAAGIYGVLKPELARQVLDQKIDAIKSAHPRPSHIVTGNPGCLMQIGAGLIAAGLDVRVAHPVELLDWSYRKARLA